MSGATKRLAKDAERDNDPKSAKTAESSESASVGNVDVLAQRMASSRGPELLLWIRKALNSADLFTFGELLDVPAVTALRNSDDAEEKRHAALLHLFAFGTYSQWISNSKLYGALSEAQERKLRQLSIVSLGRSKQISYDLLKEELHIFEVRELEDLLLDTIYAGLVVGKIDAKRQMFFVEFCIGRDVREDELHAMSAVLSAWSLRAEHAVEAIKDKVNTLRGELQRDAMERAKHQERVRELSEKLAKSALKPTRNRRVGGPSMGDDGGSDEEGIYPIGAPPPVYPGNAFAGNDMMARRRGRKRQ